MRVALNLLYLIPGVVGGTETYAAGVLDGLAGLDADDEFIVYLCREGGSWRVPEAQNFTRVVCDVPASSRWRRYLFEQLLFPIILKRASVDVVHSLGYVSPVFCPCPSVVTIH